MPLARAILDGVETLDPLPITAQRLMGVLGDAEIPIAEIAAIVENDAAVVSSLMRLANSSLYGGRFEVDEPRAALVRLGAAAALEISLGGYLKNLGREAPLYALAENELWLHSAVASAAAAEIAKEAPEAHIPTSAPIAALVHDIGKLVMVRACKADADALAQTCESRNLSLVAAERLLFECDHADIGGAVARHWKFPEAITEAIERHHDAPIVHSSPCLDAVVVADIVSKTLGVGLGPAGFHFEFDQNCLRRLGLTLAGFCRVCARTARRAAELKGAYGIQA